MLSSRFAPSYPGEDMIHSIRGANQNRIKRKTAFKEEKTIKKNETYGCAQVTTGSK